MIFTLEALQADHGDSLLLHYGDKKSPKLIVIDGGPTGVYHNVLKPRLLQMKPKDGPLPIRLMMVSHIDDDHIHGVLDLARELVTIDDKGNPLPYDIQTLWHNSFEAIVQDSPQALSASIGAATIQAASAGGAIPPDLNLSREGALVLASVAQGNQLREAAQKLAISLNDPLGDLITAPAKGANKVDLDDGLSFTIIGPLGPRVEALRRDWIKKMKKVKKPKKTEAAEFVDTSVYNLSSIVVLAEAGGKRMLLTGDARGDFVLEGLEAAGVIPKGGKLEIDVLKLPHHGSIRDVAPTFFERIVADHYIASANGKYDNPDVETLKILTEARGGDAYTIHLTNPVPAALKFFEGDRAKNKRKYEVIIRADDRPSVRVELGDPVRR